MAIFIGPDAPVKETHANHVLGRMRFPASIDLVTGRQDADAIRQARLARRLRVAELVVARELRLVIEAWIAEGRPVMPQMADGLAELALARVREIVGVAK